MVDACSHGKPGQKSQLCSSLPSQNREPPDQGQEQLGYTKLGGSRLQTHRARHTPTAAVANTNQESARERERDSVCTSRDYERLLTF